MTLHVPSITPEDDVLSAALKYADAGWYVLPVKMSTKHPGSVVGKGWPTQSSRDPKVLAAWFAGTSGLGIALHQGRSGAVAVDVDYPELLPEILADACDRTVHQSTRTNQPGRGHYLFAMPPGRNIGNSNGKLGKDWGEIRGKNGVTIVEPSHHEKAADGGRYEWVNTGRLLMLPETIAALLTDGADAEDAATDAQVTTFLTEHTEASRPELVAVWCALFAKDVKAGGSRHTSMNSKLAGAMKEARAGLIDAQGAADTLEGLFLDAVSKAPKGKQGASRAGAIARNEWAGLLSWAIAQAQAADLDEVRARVAEKVPNPCQTSTRVDAPPCDLDTTHAVFARWLGKAYDLDVLDAVLAAAAVEQIDGDPVWLMVVSGSGAAKTETVAPLAAAGAYVTSTISSEGALLSGTSRKERTASATGGLLRKIGPTGVLVIKDVTSVLSMNRDARGAVLAALREVYDGKWERNLGSDGGQSLTWTGRIVVIGAVTTAWDRAHEVISSMGDRFVLIRLDSTKGRVSSGRQAIANTGDEEAMRAELGAAVAGVLAGVDTSADLTLTGDEAELILALADIVTLGRTGVEHDYRGDVIDAHAPEMPTRFAKQLTQILRGGITLGMDRGHLLRIVARCAADSMPPLRLAALVDLLEHPASRTADVRKRIDKPRNTVDRTLQALHMLGLVTVDEDEGPTGHTVWRYSLADDVDREALERLNRSRFVETYIHPSSVPLSVPMPPYVNKSGPTFGRAARVLTPCLECQRPGDRPGGGLCQSCYDRHEAAS